LDTLVLEVVKGFSEMSVQTSVTRISSKRREANRRNARKSTGPRTPEGKARSSMNAVKHGLLSREVLVKGESEKDLVTFRKRLVSALAPLGELETLFAERVVSSAWRLRRCLRVETGVFKEEMDNRFDPLAKEGDPGLAFIRDGNGANAFTKLSRYESGIERSMFRALHELQRLQADREGKLVPPPAALDVNLTVSGSSERSAIEAEETDFEEL